MILDILGINLVWDLFYILMISNDTGVLNSGTCSSEQPYYNYNYMYVL